MKEAYQVYDIEKGYTMPKPTDETGEPQFKAYCSECGCPVYSDTFPSLRENCPHCKAEWSVDRTMKYETWTAELHHVGYTPRECGREQ